MELLCRHNFTYLTNLQINNHFLIPMDVMCKKEEQFSRVTTIQPECVYSVPVILAHKAALYLRPAGFGSVFDYLFYHNCQLLAYVFAFSLVGSWICSDELKRTDYYLSANITFKNIRDRGVQSLCGMTSLLRVVHFTSQTCEIINFFFFLRHESCYVQRFIRRRFVVKT